MSMADFGLDSERVSAATRAVRPTGASPTETDAADGADAERDAEIETEVFARATWSGIAEPGDSAAGMVTQILGAGQALTGLIERWSTRRWVDALVDGAAEPGEEGSELTSRLATQLSEGLKRWLPRIDSSIAMRGLDQAARFGARLMIPGDALWPAGMDELGVHAPIALWWRGIDDVWVAASPSIALVGARAATRYGEDVTMEASAGLVDRGFTIVSGAAYGIDGTAHRAALASRGRTIAFLAGGVDRFYPSGHDSLLTRIAEVGVVASELPCGSSPTKWRFLQRNRLIAAASAATVVLEAGFRSGSLNTAGHAASLGRPLGAVPGPVTSAASAGCHRLIREYDAVCVTNAGQMAELVGFDPAPRAAEDRGNTAGRPGSGKVTDLPPDQVRIVDALSTRSRRTVEDIARRAGMSVEQVCSGLGTLELDERARSTDTGWLAVARPRASA